MDRFFVDKKNKRMVLFMAYENRIKFYEEQIEALLYNIEEKEKSYIIRKRKSCNAIGFYFKRW